MYSRRFLHHTHTWTTQFSNWCLSSTLRGVIEASLSRDSNNTYLPTCTKYITPSYTCTIHVCAYIQYLAYSEWYSVHDYNTYYCPFLNNAWQMYSPLVCALQLASELTDEGPGEIRHKSNQTLHHTCVYTWWRSLTDHSLELSLAASENMLSNTLSRTVEWLNLSNGW